jgi:hypothetical protein
VLKNVAEHDDKRWMPIPPRVQQNWEARLGSPVELAVITRRPGTGSALAVRVAAMAAIGIALVLFVIPTHGLILIPLAPLVLAVREHTRATTATSGILPIMMVAVVTSADVILATYGGARNPLGSVCLRIPRHEVFSVVMKNRRVAELVLTNGERVPLSIGRPGDRALLLGAAAGETYVRATSGVGEWAVLAAAI